MDRVKQVKNILRDALNLGARADQLTEESPLLGSIPELDSMAVVQVITMLEDECGITVEDDELNAEVFATLGKLVRFVSEKAAV
ncbi:MAG: acyl carrier protein [Steroidobacteraceae bacterium]